MSYKSILLAAEAEGQINYQLSAIYQRNWEEQDRLRGMIEKSVTDEPFCFTNGLWKGTMRQKRGLGQEKKEKGCRKP